MRVLMTNIIALCDEGLYEELLRYVPTERQEKIARCGKRQDRMRSLAAGLLLEYGLRHPRKAGAFRRGGGAL